MAEERVPAGGTTARCRHCRTTIEIQRTRHPEPTDRAPMVWVLDNDPAIASTAVRDALEELSREHRIRLLDADERERLASEVARGRTELPDLILFGDMHVLLEDRLLSAVSARPSSATLLVSTHHNIELLSQATAFCRVDQYVSLPASVSELVDCVDALVGDPATV